MNIEIWLDKENKQLRIFDVAKENSKAIYVTRIAYRFKSKYYVHMMDVFSKQSPISQFERFNYEELKNNESVQQQFKESLYSVADLEHMPNDEELGLGFSELTFKTEDNENKYKGFRFFKTHLPINEHALSEETVYAYTDDGVYKGCVPITKNMNITAQLRLMNDDEETELMTLVRYKFKFIYEFLSKEVEEYKRTLIQNGVEQASISLPCAIESENRTLLFNRFEYRREGDEEGIAIIYGSDEKGYSRPYFIDNMDDRTSLFILSESQTQLLF